MLHLKAHSCPPLDFAELFFNRMKEIAGLFLVHVKITIAGNAEKMSALHCHSPEEGFNMLLDEVTEKNIVIPIGALGEWHQAGEDAGSLYDSDVRIESIALKFHDHIQALVEELGKGMGGIHGERSQNRINCLVEIFLKIRALVGRHIRIAMKSDSLGIEGGRDVLMPATVFIIHHSLSTRANERERFLRGEAIGPSLRGFGLHLLLETGNPHFKELIQVRADNTQKLQPLENRVVLAECLIEDTLIELQPTCLSINEIFLLGKIHTPMVFPRHDWSRVDFQQKRRKPAANRIKTPFSESNPAQQGV